MLSLFKFQSSTFAILAAMTTLSMASVVLDQYGPSHAYVSNWHLVSLVGDQDTYVVDTLTYDGINDSDATCNAFNGNPSFDSDGPPLYTGACEAYTGDHQQVLTISCYPVPPPDTYASGEDNTDIYSDVYGNPVDYTDPSSTDVYAGSSVGGSTIVSATPSPPVATGVAQVTFADDCNASVSTTGDIWIGFDYEADDAPLQQGTFSGYNPQIGVIASCFSEIRDPIA